jgi:uncharacterized protein (UPF0335 family)
MNRTVQIGVVTAAVALGVILGAILFRSRSPEPVPPERPFRPAAPPAATADLAQANDRIAALESQLRALQEKVESRSKDKETWIKELAAEAKTVVVQGEDADEMPFGWRVHNRPQAVASLLGLDAARRKTLEDTYRSFVDRIRRLEKEHARTTVDGDTTRIEIAPFPAQGKALIDDWVAQLGTILTPDERDKYKKMSLGLLPADIGQHERIIALVTERDGTVSSTEHWANGGSASYKGPKEGALAPYNHLLKK